jgi:hypothetical protein
MAHISHNGSKYPIPEGSTPQDAFESLQSAIPELSNAKLVKDGNNWKAETSYGKKG